MTDADRVRTWREQQIAKGLCVRCHQTSDRLGECSGCQERLRPRRRQIMRHCRHKRSYLYVMELLAAGMCMDCAHRPHLKGKLRCSRCEVSVRQRKSSAY